MLDSIFSIINNIVIGLVMVCLSVFTIYSLMVFIPPKKYKKAEKKNKFAVVIAARNEETVIANLIESIKQCDYPKELLDIFVVCHNCKDNTELEAKKAGANTFVLNDPNKAHHTKGYALQYAFDKLLKEYDHDYYAVFDADNVVNKDFFTEINNAHESGVKICYAYRSSKNIDANAVAGVNGNFFLRDSIFNSHARTLLHSSCIISGSGFTFAREVIADKGWTALTMAEDAEFALDYILRGYKAKYVSKAIFYDEQPTNFRIAMHRHARVCHGTNALFWKNGYKLLGKFFTKFDYTYLDAFLSFLYAPVSVLCSLWFPFYYTYLPVTMLIQGQGAELGQYLLFIAQMVGLCILVPTTIQNIILYIYSYKKLHIKNNWNFILTLLFFPFYNLFVAVANTYGIFNPKLTWKEVKHDCVVDINKLEGKE